MSKFIRSTAEKDWIEQMVDNGGDETVITFIGDIIFHPGEDVNKINVITNLFASGYCYYFAKMLEDAFPGGKVCICYPFGHIVYIYNNIPYDIDGISYAEAYEYIPIEAFGEAINDFKHIEGKEYNITIEEIETIKDKWISENDRIICLN